MRVMEVGSLYGERDVEGAGRRGRQNLTNGQLPNPCSQARHRPTLAAAEHFTCTIAMTVRFTCYRTEARTSSAYGDVSFRASCTVNARLSGPAPSRGHSCLGRLLRTSAHRRSHMCLCHLREQRFLLYCSHTALAGSVLRIGLCLIPPTLCTIRRICVPVCGSRDLRGPWNKPVHT